MPVTAPRGRFGSGGWWEIDIDVRFNEVDAYGYVWHGRYISWFEEARNDLARLFGMAPAGLEALGYRVPVHELSVTYRRPAGLEDRLVVGVRFEPSERAELCFRYRVSRPGKKKALASGWTRQVATTRDGELLVTFPPVIRDALRKLKAEQARAEANGI
jgi:acyl-CoA thioester hydrolase